MQLVTPGLVLREVKVGESDRILTILTPEHGVLSCTAKGSLRLKSKLFSACGLFCYSEFTLFAGRTLYTVDDAQVKNVFHGLANRLDAMALAMYMAEVTLMLSPSGKEGETLLRLMLNSLYLLSEKKALPRKIKAIYELRAVSEAGFMPNLLCCRECGKYQGGPFCFDLTASDLLCEDCAAKLGLAPNLDEAALTALRHIILVEDRRVFGYTIPPESQRLLNAVAEQYACRQLDKTPKTLEFLQTVLE